MLNVKKIGLAVIGLPLMIGCSTDRIDSGDLDLVDSPVFSETDDPVDSDATELESIEGFVTEILGNGMVISEIVSAPITVNEDGSVTIGEIGEQREAIQLVFASDISITVREIIDAGMGGYEDGNGNLEDIFIDDMIEAIGNWEGNDFIATEIRVLTFKEV